MTTDESFASIMVELADIKRLCSDISKEQSRIDARLKKVETKAATNTQINKEQSSALNKLTQEDKAVVGGIVISGSTLVALLNWIIQVSVG